MRAFWSCTIGAIVCAAVVGVAVGSASAQQRPASSTSPNRIVVIGCLQRARAVSIEILIEPDQQPRTVVGGADAFTIRDFRAGGYRLEGDEKLLTLHPGHQVEIAGTVLERGGPTTTPRFKVESLHLLSPTCWK